MPVINRRFFAARYVPKVRNFGVARFSTVFQGSCPHVNVLFGSYRPSVVVGGGENGGRRTAAVDGGVSGRSPSVVAELVVRGRRPGAGCQKAPSATETDRG